MRNLQSALPCCAPWVCQFLRGGARLAFCGAGRGGVGRFEHPWSTPPYYFQTQAPLIFFTGASTTWFRVSGTQLAGGKGGQAGVSGRRFTLLPNLKSKILKMYEEEKMETQRYRQTGNLWPLLSCLNSLAEEILPVLCFLISNKTFGTRIILILI